MLYPWSSLVEGGEGSFLPNCQTNLVIALYTLSLLFCKFINTTAYHLGRIKPSSPVSCHATFLLSEGCTLTLYDKFGLCFYHTITSLFFFIFIFSSNI